MERMSATDFIRSITRVVKSLTQVCEKFFQSKRKSPMIMVSAGLITGTTIEMLSNHLALQAFPSQDQLEGLAFSNCNRSILLTTYFITLSGRVLAHALFALTVLYSMSQLDHVWVNPRIATYPMQKKTLFSLGAALILMATCFFSDHFYSVRLLDSTLTLRQKETFNSHAICSIQDFGLLHSTLYKLSAVVWVIQTAVWGMLYQFLIAPLQALCQSHPDLFNILTNPFTQALPDQQAVLVGPYQAAHHQVAMKTSGQDTDENALEAELATYFDL